MRATVSPQRKTTLYDYNGNPVSTTGYITGGSARRSMRGWFPSANSADKDIIPKIDSLRASSRDLSMNSPVAAGALLRFKDNVIGYGLFLQARIDLNFLGLNYEQAKTWTLNTEREFKLFAESPEIDASRTDDFYNLQALTYFSKLQSGDVFYLLPRIPRQGVVYDTRVKVLEADMVSNPNNQMDTETLAGGIETDSDGAPVAYYISKRHPGGLNYFGNEWIKVDAFAPRTGLRQVYHMFDRFRPGQRRGIPLFAPVIESLKQITRLTESELMAAVVSSFFTVFIKTQTGDGLSDAFDDSTTAKDPGNIPDDKNIYEIGNGNIIDLANGEEIQLADPKRPNSAYAPFFQVLVEEIGSAIGMPTEILTLHFQSSYSAARAALLMAWKSFMVHRMTIARTFCQPIYERWLLEAVLKGRIKAPGFLESAAYRKAWSGAKWLGQGQGQINPVVETKAAIDKIEAKLSTRSKEVAMMDGDDWDTMIDSAAQEERIIRDKFSDISNKPNNTDVNRPEFKGNPDE